MFAAFRRLAVIIISTAGLTAVGGLLVGSVGWRDVGDDYRYRVHHGFDGEVRCRSGDQCECGQRDVDHGDLAGDVDPWHGGCDGHDLEWDE